MLRAASPIAPPAAPPCGGGHVQQVCGVSMKTSVSVPRRSQRRKRVLETYEEDPSVFGAKSSASKKLFSSRGNLDTLPGTKIKQVVVKTEVEVARISEKLLVPPECVERKVEELDLRFGEGDCNWRPLGVGRAELCLDLTLLTGQSFRWRKTGVSQYTGVVGAHLISLRQVCDEVEFCHHSSSSLNVAESDVEKELRDYLNLDTNLVELYARFTAADARFAAVAPFIAGARLLRQSPLECVFQFICSSNNHIQRITTMVDHLSSWGSFLGCVHGIRFHQFPSLEELLPVSESQLRENGFGYR